MAGQNLELHLPDEDREFPLSWLDYSTLCPECKSAPKLVRRTHKHRVQYSVRCSWRHCSGTFNTPFVNSSEKARAAWRLACVLLKP